MDYTLYRATIELHSPLGTPLVGDTLFGQLCWALREQRGEKVLSRYLSSYTQGAPWLVVSDGFPSGYFPKPTLPTSHLHINPEQRKRLKKMRWIALQDVEQLHLATGYSDAEAYAAIPQEHLQAHNTINRYTNTTGKGEFAPYSTNNLRYSPNQSLDIWLVINNHLVEVDEVRQLLIQVGQLGFGRDASTGLGKFSLVHFAASTLTTSAQGNAWLTLAPCAPQGLDLCSAKSYWRTQTRFGRHGNIHALTGRPFKAPMLMAATGAVFSPKNGQLDQRLWLGQGLTGISKALSQTVHQGYAPVIPFYLASGMWKHESTNR